MRKSGSKRNLLIRLVVRGKRSRAAGAGILAGAAVFAGLPVREARAQYVGQISSYVADTRTGAVLSQDNADLQRYPASLTKLMTLYMTFRALKAGRISLDQELPVSIHASLQEPSKLGLRPGGYLTVEQAILGLVTKSANDAACALGEYIGGGNEAEFAAMMTQQARYMGMTRTTFRNASGLPDPDQVTTARDLGTLAVRLISDFPEYYHYFSTPMFYFHGMSIPNHNPMLRFYPGADGMKTGYTAQAGLNLVSSAIHGNVRLVGVVMGAQSRGQRQVTMAHILDDGFSAEGLPPEPYNSFPVVRPGRPVVLARTERHVRGRKKMVLAAASSSGNGRSARPLEVAQASRIKRPSAPIRLVATPLKHKTSAATAHKVKSLRHRT
ncbi:D-alanyl-D-alanine carboxypeptidase [Acetobacter sp. AN02]|uniref:D-alanyl-D-alanine carboxypeptidase family protein n=1 Tax=Acetobacter sp. AN02 TaxID=2894186 RepID=UPI0024341079|nr:D-alanyl-D-alanine carboxypeptidase [Acetobacter sp. AN02]MDG6094865.1 D-alanyl-D-alanine carboxypeptidase [Acetobacter sp. AN02]